MSILRGRWWVDGRKTASQADGTRTAGIMAPFAKYFWLALYLAPASIAVPSQPYSDAIDNGTFGPYPVRTYITEPDVTSPRLNWLQWNPACDDGHSYFLTPRGSSLTNPGPMILDGNGDLVWSQFFDNGFGGQAYDLKVQQYQGQDYLTFWLGNDAVRGHGAGLYYMLNSSYDVVHRVNAAGTFEADLHEFLITPQGTALLTVYDKQYKNLTLYRDFDPEEDRDDEQPNYIWDCLIQEISIHDGSLLFQWRASDHIDLSQTYRDIEDEGTLEVPWDWFHANSIAKDELGNYLVSARYTHSITYIDAKTGQTLWSLGGKRNSFMDLGGDSIAIAWQHDARFHPVDDFPDVYTAPPAQEGVTRRLLTVFDNAVEDTVSRGLLLELTYPPGQASNSSAGSFEDDVAQNSTPNGTDPAYTVRVIQSYENPRKVRSSSQGSMQVLSEDDETKVLVGYGFNALWTEYASDGTVLCDIHYGAQTSWESGSIQSYRVFKFDWTGAPTTKPRMAASDDNLEVYMSWNGATEVAEWLIQGCKTVEGQEDDWTDVFRVPKHGFETAAELPAKRKLTKRFLRAVALSNNGSILDHGVSEVLDLGELYSIPTLDLAAGPLLEAAMYMVVIVAATAFCFQVLKRLRWRGGPSGSGRIRWKENTIYHRLSGDW